MNKKMSKNQWVAVIISLAVVGLILFFSFRTSPELVDFEETFMEEGRVENDDTNQDLLLNFNEMSEINIEEENFENLEQLMIKDINIGTGNEAVNGNTVVVNYSGFLTNGEKFDSTWERSKPFEFTLGEGFVISGWEEGVLGMKEGGVRQLVIPPELGYGDKQVGPIPPNSVLIFVVELLEIKE